MTPASHVESPLTQTPAKYLFTAKVLGKHDAHYYYDEEAKYIFVDKPFWLDEAYDAAISITDTGILSRNENNFRVVSDLIEHLEIGENKMVDLGAGYGLFVRGMRDRGYDFYWSDKYAENLVSRGFEATPSQPYKLAAAFEVLEHTTNPLEFILESRDTYGFDFLAFSATCFDPLNIPDRDWWYWSFESGQHICFFSEHTLEWIAGKMNLSVRKFKSDVYVMGDPAPLAKLHKKKWRTKKVKRESLTFPDHLKMVQKLRTGSQLKDSK
jgi:hypothetical protein